MVHRRLKGRNRERESEKKRRQIKSLLRIFSWRWYYTHLPKLLRFWCVYCMEIRNIVQFFSSLRTQGHKLHLMRFSVLFSKLSWFIIYMVYIHSVIVCRRCGWREGAGNKMLSNKTWAESNLFGLIVCMCVCVCVSKSTMLLSSHPLHLLSFLFLVSI